MIISLEETGRNLAHVDYKVHLDSVLSGAIRLWVEEIDSFQFFIELWNAKQNGGTNRIGQSKGDVSLMIDS
jgi:hypothetical protein